ncbi:ABC transporter ATP-binding protein [Ornithinicoccus hortensis]|uniref:ABC-2 type transport system ATP-binding protein n=1 Tax=Ornithinicoccus hortensis TaxID=82346 RepID=A0A542YWI1_9MICO|nr:ABC transporter ATP-binding protein [Ornithinicoccus hortensis]TQL52447.1 ABC-2 type transport system ATP-binding protein [Ornithinicoccus hortensis]
MNTISATGLLKSYGDRAVLRGVDLQVPEGSISALLGPNGAGKTSLVEILEGHRRRDGGSLQVLGLDPGSRADFGQLRRVMGVVLQQTMLEPGPSVHDLLRRQASYYRRPADVDEMVSTLELTDHVSASVRSLSGGLRRRLDIALALIGRPRILFLDEPTTGLDPLSRRNIRALITEVNTAGTTVVLTSHDLEEVQQLADRVHVLSGGNFVTEGSPSDLIHSSGTATRVTFRIGSADTALLPGGAVLEGDTVRYEVTDQDALLAQLSSWSRDQGVQLDGLTISQPSLDDAYAALVGATTTDGGR